MKNIYIVEGHHWSVPGKPITAHSTSISADREALILVNIIRKDLEMSPCKSWRRGLIQAKKRIQKEYLHLDDEGCDVSVTKLEIQS